MTKKQKAVKRFFANGGKVQRCPLGYAVAPVGDRVTFNPLSGGPIQWFGDYTATSGAGRSTIRFRKGQS